MPDPITQNIFASDMFSSAAAIGASELSGPNEPNGTDGAEQAGRSGEAADVKRMLDAAIRGHIRPRGADASSAPLSGTSEALRNALADRPLNGPLADVADETVALLMLGGSIRGDGVERLAELRAEGLAANLDARISPEDRAAFRAFMDAACSAALIAPLTGEIAAANPAAAAGIVEMGSAIMERLASATTPDALEQLRDSLNGLRALLEQEGAFGANAQEAFSRLEALFDGKARALASIDELLARVNGLKGGAPEDIRALADVVRETAGRLRGASPDPGLPALGEVFLDAQASEADALTSALAGLSSAVAGPLLEAGGALLGGLVNDAAAAAARKEGAAGRIADDAAGASKLLERFSEASGKCLAGDADKLARLSGQLASAAAAARKLSDAAALSEASGRSAASLEAASRELSELDRSRLPAKLSAALDREAGMLDAGARGLRAGAARHEERFIESITERIGRDHAASKDLGGIRDDIHKHIDGLAKGFNPNLSDTQLAEVKERLLNLAQQTFIEEFAAGISDAVSTRLDAPSLAECAERISASTDLSQAARAELEGKLSAASKGILSGLSDRMKALTDRIPAMTFEELLDLPTADLMREGEMRLLPGEREAFRRDMDALFEAASRRFETLEFASLDAAWTSSLSDSAKSGLRRLLSTGGHAPGLARALTGMSGEILCGLAEGAPASGETMRELERRLLPEPGLDEALGAIRRAMTDGSPEAIEKADASQASLIARRNVMTLAGALLSKGTIKAMGGVEGEHPSVISGEALRLLITAAADRKSPPGQAAGTVERLRLSGADLTLLRARLAFDKAEGRSFEDFRADLPEPFKSIPNLESVLGTNLSSTRTLASIGRDAARVARGFGGINGTAGRDMLEVCERLARGDDRWAAGAALTRISRNLLNARSVTGEQANEGQATALRSAIGRAMDSRRVPDRLRDALRVLTGSAQAGVSASDADAQIARFCAQSDDLVADALKMNADADALAAAREAVLKDPGRQEMLRRLSEFRPEAVEGTNGALVIGKGFEGGIGGAMLSTGVLLLEEILEHPEGLGEGKGVAGFTERQALIRMLDFQRHADLGRMEGKSAPGPLSGAPKDFADLIDALRRAPTEAAFNDASARMLGMLKAANADEKARTVLFFKGFRSHEGVEAMNQKIGMTLTHAAKKDLKTNPDSPLAALRQRLQTQLAGRAGAAGRQNDAAEIAALERRNALEQAEATLASSTRFFSSRVLDAVDRTVELSLCHAFLSFGPDAGSLEDVLKAERESRSPGAGPLFSKALDHARRLGLEEGVAKPFLMKAIGSMGPDYFTALQKNTRAKAELAFREAATRLQTPSQMRALIRAGAFKSVVHDLVDGMKDPGATLTLSADREASLTFPVFESGSIEVSAGLSAAVRNGVAVRRDGDGALRMTLLRTRSASACAAIEGLLDLFEAGAKISGGIGTGCEITFRNDAACERLLTALLAGDAPQAAGLLPASGEIRRASLVSVEGELSIEASISVSGLAQDDKDAPATQPAVNSTAADAAGKADAAEDEDDEEDDDWASASFGLELAGSASIETLRDAAAVSRAATLSGRMSVSASYQIAPDSVVEKLEDAASTVRTVDRLANTRVDPLNAAVSGLSGAAEKASDLNSGEKALLELQFSERREKTRSSADNRVTSASRTRTFAFSAPDDADQALEALERLGVPAATRRDVARDIALGRISGDFTLSVRRELTRSGVERAAASKGRLRASDFRLTEVSVRTTSDSASVSRGVSREHAALARTMAGGVGRTLRYAAQSV